MNDYPRGTAVEGAGLTTGAGRLPSRRSAAALFSLSVTLLLVVARPAEATTYTAASPSLIDVAAKVTIAADGDTVVVPAGTASWTSTLTITKAITLQGAGIGQTIIKDEVPRTTNPCTLITFTHPPYRFTGFTLQLGTVNTSAATNGCLVIIGTAPTTANIRVDHIRFAYVSNSNIVAYNVCGVIDHCTFDRGFNNAIVVHHANWGGRTYGDGSWSDPLSLGTDKALYVEDCTFTTNSQYGSEAIDSYNGGRWVFRHNTVHDDFVATHEMAYRNRAPRSFEIYENTFTNTHVTVPCAVESRAGTGVAFNNTCTGYQYFMQANDYRQFRNFAFWGGADGLNAWDINDTTDHTGNGLGGGIGGLYASGTAASGSGLTMTKTGAGWTTNQWAGYQLLNTTTGRFSEIVSNTVTTITWKSTSDSNFPEMVFSAGNSYTIRKVVAAIDQVGRGKGDLLSGDTPTPRWTNQASEPVYQWNNTLNGASNPVMTSNNSVVQVNRDFYNNVQMPGYTPYVYPHPLVTGGALAPPPAPANLRVLSGP